MVNKYKKKNKENLQKEAQEKYQDLSEEDRVKRWKKAPERYKNLSEEEKEKKGQNHWDQNKSLSEEEGQKKVEYTKNYYLTLEKIILGSYKVVGN